MTGKKNIKEDMSMKKENSNSKSIDSRYSFESFVVSDNNKNAYYAALEVANNPGNEMNPLYIYGDTGIGKTHLLKAIEGRIKKTRPDLKVIYVTGEEFTNDVIESIRSGNQSTISEMRDRYRTADVLIVDDITFIAGKDATQEELFSTFDTLHLKGKQIVISADNEPKMTEGLDVRFINRFSMGLCVKLDPPSFEEKRIILNEFFKDTDYTPDSVFIDYLALEAGSDYRYMKASCTKVKYIMKSK